MKTFLLLLFISCSALGIQIQGVFDTDSGLFFASNQVIQGTTPFWESRLESSTQDQCSEGAQRLKPHESKFYIWIAISVALTLFGGLMSGLTVGYMSINDLNLQIKIKSGTNKEVKAAKRVLPILQQHHWLLVTLLLANAAAMEALPIFLDSLVPSYAAVLISVTAVLIFGEILPQAVCTGPSQIEIAAAVAPITRILMWLLSPISYPISLMLDCCLGKHHKARFQNKELKELVQLHSKQELQNLKLNQAKQFTLEQSQTHLIMKAIDLNKDTAREVMKDPSEMVMLSSQAPFSHDTMAFIEQSGFSRIPIFQDQNQQLIVLLTQPVSPDIALAQLKEKFVRPLIVHPEAKLMEVLHKFQQGFCHFAIVTDNVKELQRGVSKFEDEDVSLKLLKGSKNSHSEGEANLEILGFFTMADILEHVFQIDFYDETDLAGMTQRRTIHQGRWASDLEIQEQPQLKQGSSKIRNSKKWESKLRPIGEDLDESLLSLEGFMNPSPNLGENQEIAMADMSPRKNRKSIRRGLVAVSGQPPQVNFLAPHPISQERMKSEFNL